jgi:hypothetical protein
MSTAADGSEEKFGYEVAAALDLCPDGYHRTRAKDNQASRIIGEALLAALKEEL